MACDGETLPSTVVASGKKHCESPSSHRRDATASCQASLVGSTKLLSLSALAVTGASERGMGLSPRAEKGPASTGAHGHSECPRPSAGQS